MLRRTFTLSVGMAVVLVLALALAVGSAGAAAPAHSTAPPQYVQTALYQLARLAVKAAAPMTGYSRDQFGP